MVKLIGVLLIASSLLSLIAGAFIDLEYGTSEPITGNVVSNILTQPEVDIGLFDYLVATAFAYSILSLIMGVMFLFRV